MGLETAMTFLDLQNQNQILKQENERLRQALERLEQLSGIAMMSDDPARMAARAVLKTKVAE